MAAEVNFLSDLFPAESELIDDIITSTPRFATLERARWYQFLYSQDDTCIWLSATDAALNQVAYAQAISNIADETYVARFMGLAHEFLSKTYSDQLFVMDPLTPLSVHSIIAGIQTGVKASHLSKIWGIYI